MDFGRVMTAMVTPFNSNLEIDYDKTKNLVNHLIATGTDTIVVAGSTGESSTLNKEEKLQLFEHVMVYADGRAKVIAGTGSNDTRGTIELTKKAEEIGVDGVMLVAPYYNKPTQEGLYQHFRAVANETKLPVMIYNVPSRTSVNIEANTIIRLAEIANVFAVKEASGNLSQMAEIIKNTSDDFYLYSGDDKLTLPVLAIGGHGIVSVASHVVGKEINELVKLYLQGSVKEATELHLNLLKLFEGIFITSNPAPIKELLNNLGIDVGSVRLPLISLNEEESKQLLNIYKAI